LNKWIEAVLREEWHRALTAAGKLAESPERFWSWLGLINLSITRLARGMATPAIENLDAAASAYSESDHLSATARNMTAHVLIESGRAAEAMVYAQHAMKSAGASPLAHESLYFLGLAKLRMGELDDASSVLEQLDRQTRASSPAGGRARFYQLSGEIDLARGATRNAVRALTQARETLEKASSPRPRIQEPIRYSLAIAYHTDGRQAEALSTALESAEDKRGLLEWPIPYVRNLYFAGTRQADAGNLSEARYHNERFIAYWNEGEIDSQMVQEAKRFLASSSGSRSGSSRV
jgi:tetratricopeptide (TPR) repeat protein